MFNDPTRLKCYCHGSGRHGCKLLYPFGPDISLKAIRRHWAAECTQFKGRISEDSYLVSKLISSFTQESKSIISFSSFKNQHTHILNIIDALLYNVKNRLYIKH